MPNLAFRPVLNFSLFLLLVGLLVFSRVDFALANGDDEEKSNFSFKDYSHSTEKAPSLDQVRARACLLIDATTGKILYERNADERHLPASTVKLMTGLIAFEQMDINSSITIIPDDLKVEPSWVPLTPGETVKVDPLLHALLIFSANDSARALARKVAGTDDAFVSLMNERASQLGCTNTHYANPNGLPAANEYCSCRDLLKIFEAVIAHPELRLICSMPSYTISVESGHHVYRNHNLMLGRYPGMGPAKTGWTVASRHTYAAACDRMLGNGERHELILTLMDSPNKWFDIPILFNYGFATIADGGPSFPIPANQQQTAPSRTIASNSSTSETEPPSTTVSTSPPAPVKPTKPASGTNTTAPKPTAKPSSSGKTLP